MAAATFTAFVLLGNTLTPEVIFPSLTLFGLVTWAILRFPDMISHFSMARVSILRLNEFLRREELPEISYSENDNGDGDDEEEQGDEDSEDEVMGKENEDEAQVIIKEEKRNETVIELKEAEFEWVVDRDDGDEEEEGVCERKKESKVEVLGAIEEATPKASEMVRILNADEREEEEEEDVMLASLARDEEAEAKEEHLENGDVEEGAEDMKMKEKDKACDSGKLFRLTGLNCEVKRGQLIGIIGRVGSGKSSLLSAMLGEMKQTRGEMRMTGSQRGKGVSYVGQKAWICNASVRDNILFYGSYDQERYGKVVRACELLEDFRVLPAGDNTEIGERGKRSSN
jgi:ABC-type multidrug transport system fused ATPase/permease subunit